MKTRSGVSIALTIAAGILCAPAALAQGAAPRYEPDLSWPKPLPDRWVLGGLGGVCVDAQDHVFILNRQDVIEGDLNAGKLAPPIANQRLVFVVNQNNSQIEIIERESGKHLASFGRPGAFPGEFIQAHGIAVDSKGNVFVAENRGRRIHKFKITAK